MRGCPGAEASREPEKGKRALLEGQVRAASPAGALTKREPTRPTSKCCPCTNYLHREGPEYNQTRIRGKR